MDEKQQSKTIKDRLDAARKAKTKAEKLAHLGEAKRLVEEWMDWVRGSPPGLSTASKLVLEGLL
jgi:hypothetical protein